MTTQTNQVKLSAYYKKAFPFDNLYRWLSYGDDVNFMRREFAFVIRQGAFMRYVGFSSREKMKLEFLRFVPSKIDIGAIYNTSPRFRRSQIIFPVQREFVIDIDLSDYNQRSCCVNANICCKCWKFIVVTAAILKSFLTEIFGFAHILWTFSGRRGLHCWICDKTARELSAVQRAWVVRHVTLFESWSKPEEVATMITGKHVPYSVRLAVKIASSMFESLIVSEADVLGTEQGVKYFLDLLPDKQTRHEVEILFSKFETSLERWKAFVAYFNDPTALKDDWRGSEGILDAMRLIYCCPRIDISVSKSDMHLLKSPFSVHPQTGCISVPFRFEDIPRFDPLHAPTVQSALDELNHPEEDDHLSFDKSLNVFKEFVDQLEAAEKRYSVP